MAEKSSEVVAAADNDTNDEETNDFESGEMEDGEVDVKDDVSTEPWEKEEKPEDIKSPKEGGEGVKNESAEDVKDPVEVADDITKAKTRDMFEPTEKSKETADTSEDTKDPEVPGDEAAELQHLSAMAALQRLLVTETRAAGELEPALACLAGARLARLSPGLALRQPGVPLFQPGARERRLPQSPACLLAGLRAVSGTLARLSSGGLAPTACSRPGVWIHLGRQREPSPPSCRTSGNTWLDTAKRSYKEEEEEVKEEKGKGRGRGLEGRGRGRGRSSSVAGKPGRRAAAKTAAEKFVEEEEIEEYSSGDDFQDDFR